MITEQQHKLIIKLAKAGLKKQKVYIEYEYLAPRRGFRAAIIIPHHFVKGVRGGADKLHVVGYDYEVEGIRQFAISNIKKVKVLKLAAAH